ncbi:hypothetical protein LZ31DRAFT_616581 [Colletotrichum somersetense]|nr:hypothetical protein LZ31DRAFT_616581 [Colletotrichum somersetense]
MTKSPRGPSLPQARSYHHNHYHLHNKRAVTPENAHQHRQLDVAVPADAQPSTTQGPKTVVETVSVIQIVDASGLPIELQTLYPTSVTVDAAATISAALDLSIPAVLSPSATSDSTSQSPSISSGTTPSTPAATTPSPTSSSASQDTSLTGPEGGSRGMVQRSLSYGRSAAGVGSGTAAAARKHSRRASEPSETGERGFVRVSGRKLPSVLQSGGDGYTDPGDIVAPVAPFGGGANDDESVYYRDSRAFFDPGGHDGQSPRLALGSPMRPESGVVVFKESPARTPVTESAPFADPNASLSPSPPPTRDPIGRTLPSQDGSRDSRGSASRFQEQM